MVRKKFRNFIAVVLTGLLATCLHGVASPAEMMTITGSVNTDYEIVSDDGKVYEVVENLKGKEVVELIDRKVRVTGSVTKQGKVKKIRIDAYEVLDQ
ncbi:MAG: hypothetical protein JSV50_18920 [Desulfobacteraceae bacterium]|nr:MAG: hypothetical protein JSV50_18920 [Desulfobacteraceae bacterium]